MSLDPTTEAGRTLLARTAAYGDIEMYEERIALVLAIEAEARAPLEARVRELEAAVAAEHEFHRGEWAGQS